MTAQRTPAYTPPTKLPLTRTPKADGDYIVINPALKAWMERRG